MKKQVAVGQKGIERRTFQLDVEQTSQTEYSFLLSIMRPSSSSRRSHLNGALTGHVQLPHWC